MPRESKVGPQCPPPPVSKPVLSEQGEVILLDGDPVMDVYNLSFDELQQKIIRAQINHFPNDHASPAFMKESVIMSYVRKHPVTMADATMAYARATSSNVKFLLAKNEQMENNLQAGKQKIEQSARSAMAEMRK